jgi:transmembrane sensor
MKEIFEKYIYGNCTSEEEKLIKEKLGVSATSGEILQLLKKHWYEVDQSNFETDANFDLTLNRIHHTVNSLEEEERKSQFTLLHRFYSWSRIAAAVVIIFMASVGVWYSGYKGLFQKEVFYTVSCVRGQSSSVELPDGSQVWLNGASSIVYSSRYGYRNRHIELEGEGFFSVEKNAGAPFVVKSGDIEVTALGTRFNVDAFLDDKPVKVTLEEGRVNVFYRDESIEMEPGMQVVVDNNEMNLRQVDTQLFTSWHSGTLIFRDEVLHSIACQLGKIYDVEFVFETDELKSFRYRGAVSLDNSILKALEMLRFSTGIKYEIHGNKIMLKK